VYQTLAEEGGRAGFDAGQAVQFNRTLGGDLGIPLAGAVLRQTPSGLTPAAGAQVVKAKSRKLPPR
jgi:hypothetical protein